MQIDRVLKQQVLIAVTSHHIITCVSHCLLIRIQDLLVSLKSSHYLHPTSDLKPRKLNMEPITYPLRNHCQYQNHR